MIKLLSYAFKFFLFLNYYIVFKNIYHLIIFIFLIITFQGLYFIKDKNYNNVNGL